MSRFHFVRAGILVDAIDINGDDPVFHENIRLIPFAGRLLAAVGMLLHDREGRTGNAGLRLVFCQVRTAEQDEITRVTGMHIDRNAGDALVHDFAMQHERMRLALEAARDGILDWTPATGEAYFSPRYLAMCGYIPADFPPHIDSWTKRIHPDDLDIAVNRQRELIDSPTHGDMYECIYRFRTIHGDYKWMLGRSKIIARDRNGKALRIIGLHTDITELRNRQESLTHLINHDTLTGLYSRL